MSCSVMSSPTLNRGQIVHFGLFVEYAGRDLESVLRIVGNGSFGVVWKGKWHERTVAIKMLSVDTDDEIDQLSRVSHENIIQIFGTFTKDSNLCLVMEFSEMGSLSRVLHSDETSIFPYNLTDAISWLLQCAKGVSYLHNMDPKPLIHRDLKPENLLLFDNGATLKICDFGSAIYKSAHVISNKASAAWMAPEAFETGCYDEKCDVFSWGIILWEVLARQRPLSDISGPAYCLMWAIHNGQRPPLLRNCPGSLEKLMLSCWHSEPNHRPSMDDIVIVMQEFQQQCPRDPDSETLPYSPKNSISGKCDSNEEDVILDDLAVFQIDGNKENKENSIQFNKIAASNLKPLELEFDLEPDNSS